MIDMVEDRVRREDMALEERHLKCSWWDERSDLVLDT